MSVMGKVKIPDVTQRVRPNGEVWLYCRKKDTTGKMRWIRLPDDPGSAEFSKALRQARKKLGGSPDPTPRSKRAPKNTFRWLCEQYMSSGEFQQLDLTTQGKRRAIIDRMCDEPLKPNSDRFMRDCPVPAFAKSHVRTLRDRKASTPFAANERLKVLRRVFAFAMDEEIVEANVAADVKPFRVATEGHRVWTIDDIRTYLSFWESGSKQRLALMLLLFTGLRISDVQKIGPQHRRGDSFVIPITKGRNQKPKTLTIPIHPLLAEHLDSVKVAGMAYLLTEHGRPFSIKSLSHKFSDWCKRAGLPQGCTAHGVRKCLSTILADGGASEWELASLMGWDKTATAAIYTRKANRTRLAQSALSRLDLEGIENEMLHDATTHGDPRVARTKK